MNSNAFDSASCGEKWLQLFIAVWGRFLRGLECIRQPVNPRHQYLLQAHMMTPGLSTRDRAVWSVSLGSSLHHNLNISIPVFLSGRQLSQTPHRSLLMNIKRDIFLRVRSLLFILFIVSNSLISHTFGLSASNLIVQSSACKELASLHYVDLAVINADDEMNVLCKAIMESITKDIKPAVWVSNQSIISIQMCGGSREERGKLTFLCEFFSQCQG